MFTKRNRYEPAEPPDDGEEVVYLDEESDPTSEEVVTYLRQKGHDVRLDADHDPSFHVTEAEFNARVRTPYYRELLASCGYTSAYQVVADVKEGRGDA